MEPLRIAYLLAFGLAAAACFGTAHRARGISDRDTRIGLLALLGLSGAWATASTIRLLPSPPPFQQAFYIVGLVAGLATVGAWLYFCSAYTGHDYHHDPTIRTLAVATFLAISSIKLTNPLHHLYFTTTTTTTPFPHTVIELHPFHWVVTGLAYALSAIGFYLLYELFTRSNLDTRPLAGLVAVTAVPALIDILAYTESFPALLLKFNFEPIGVAIFALGALYVIDETFVAVPRFWRQHVLDHLNEAIIVVDPSEQIRDYNPAATEMFAGLTDAIGSPLSAAAPALQRALNDDAIFELDDGTESRFYSVRSTTLSGVDGGPRGRVLICADVTDIERQRRQLQRQTGQFDDFAEAITHELRNTTTIINGYLELLADTVTEPPGSSEPSMVSRVSDELGRMQTVVRELTSLAQYSRPAETLVACDLDASVQAGRSQSEADGIEYELSGVQQVQADEKRLTALFFEVFVFAAARDVTTVRVTSEEGTLRITDDGRPLSEGELGQAAAYGEPVPSADAGMALPNVRMLARSLGWELTVEATGGAGVELRLHGVEFAGESSPRG